MVTATDFATQPAAQVAPVQQDDRFDDIPQYVTQVIAGKVVSIPRVSAVVGPEGEITIPVFDYWK